MKKFLFGAAAIAAAVTAFTSCSSHDEAVDPGTGPVKCNQTITMSVANSGDNFAGTRADRDLLSSDAKQSIENVRVVICYLAANEADAAAAKYDGTAEVVAVKDFSEWMNNSVSSVYTSNGHGRQASWTLSENDQIQKPGYYIAYAVGYNTTGYNQNFESWKKFLAIGKKGTMKLTTQVQATDPADIREIFAGESDVFQISEKEINGVKYYDFNTSITLHRQVAGVLGYFTNIPIKGNADYATETGETLRLVCSNQNNQICFAGFNSGFTTKDNNIAYMINGSRSGAEAFNARFYGSTSDDAYTVYSINLRDWFKNLDDNAKQTDPTPAAADNLLNANDTWNLPAALEGKAEVMAGSVLAGKFMIPVSFDNNKPTFQLQLLSGNTIIRYWTIRLADNAGQLHKDVTVKTVGTDGNLTDMTVKENRNRYSVLRNHLYAIGLRDRGDTPDNPGGTDPDNPNPDDPTDLNNETLLIKVNDNWEVVNQMVID